MTEWEIGKLALALNSLMEVVSVKTGDVNPRDLRKLKKKYGFQLEFNPKNGFYDIRYKDLKANKRIGNRVCSYFSTEIEAAIFAINNREDTIRRYIERKADRQERAKSVDIYEMLQNYYREESPYLEDDRQNGKGPVPTNQMTNHNGFIRKHLMPYLKGRDIKTIKEVTPDVYSGLKTYLEKTAKTKSGKNLAPKTINNYLDAFNRILIHHERKGIIALPYTSGNGVINQNILENSFTEKKILPTEHLKGIFGDSSGGSETLPLLIAKVALATGMRKSEMEKIKRKDIHRILGVEDAYYLRVENHKIKRYARSVWDLYRKIPIHPYIFNMLREYINEAGIGQEDYIFIKDSGSGIKKEQGLYKFEKGLFELNNLLLIRKMLANGGDTALSEKIKNPNVRKALKEAGISFH